MVLVIGVPFGLELVSTTSPYRKSTDDHCTVQLHNVVGHHPQLLQTFCDND